MLSFVRKATKFAYKNPTENMPNPSRLTKIRWAEAVETHTYESNISVPRPTHEKSIQRSDPKIFRNEASAKYHDRKKVQQLLAQQYRLLLPSLVLYKLSQKSVEELETIQNELIDALDRMSQADPTTGLCESGEYCESETKLNLVLQALECMTQRTYIENLINSDLSLSKDKNKRRRHDSFDNEHSRACFAFM